MTLSTLWAWAIAQTDTLANTVAPYQINVAYPDDPDPIQARDVIVGRPFSRPFMAYVDKEERLAPVEAALEALQSDPSFRPDWEIVWAIIHGQHRDPEMLRGIMGMTPQVFDMCAERGLRFVKDRTDAYLRAELAKISERTQRAGEATSQIDAERMLTKRQKRGRFTASV